MVYRVIVNHVATHEAEVDAADEATAKIMANAKLGIKDSDVLEAKAERVTITSKLAQLRAMMAS